MAGSGGGWEVPSQGQPTIAASRPTGLQADWPAGQPTEAQLQWYFGNGGRNGRVYLSYKLFGKKPWAEGRGERGTKENVNRCVYLRIRFRVLHAYPTAALKTIWRIWRVSNTDSEVL